MGARAASFLVALAMSSACAFVHEDEMAVAPAWEDSGAGSAGRLPADPFADSGTMDVVAYTDGDVDGATEVEDASDEAPAPDAVFDAAVVPDVGSDTEGEPDAQMPAPDAPSQSDAALDAASPPKKRGGRLRLPKKPKPGGDIDAGGGSDASSDGPAKRPGRLQLPQTK